MADKKNRISKDSANKILEALKRLYPEAKTSLNYSNTIQLLVATMLSAQCTDKRVNIVTESLFKKYRTVKDFAAADHEILKDQIKPVGFYSVKAGNVIRAAKMILGKFKGKVPDTIEQLTALPGVGRKTANIVLYNAFSKNQGIAVDTHVKRLSQRLCLTGNKTPENIELDLMKLFSSGDWGKVNNLFIAHGRSVCTGQRPRCVKCPIISLCGYDQKNLKRESAG